MLGKIQQGVFGFVSCGKFSNISLNLGGVMAKETLEVKIKRVRFWTLILSALYFALAAWLKSDGLIFDKIKTYELLKDTLTLTAAFLAPVAAFVLYSEWRVSHRLIKNEQLIEDLHIDIRDINYKLSMLVFNLSYQVNQDDENVMLPYKADLKNLDDKHFRVLSEIERNKSNFDNQIFFNKAKEYMSACYSLIKDVEEFIKCNSEYNKNRTAETLGKRLNAYNKFNESRIDFELKSYESVVAIRVAADKYFI